MAHMMTGCFQHDADAVFARQIWWESCKALLEKDCVQPTTVDALLDVSDTAVKEFIKRCEAGFFNVKPTEKPIEA